MPLEPGTLVNERLRLVRPLGRGGMGSVWIAHHETLDIDVAVKFIAPELAFQDDPNVLQRFQREAQLAAKLTGPHVVRVLDHGVSKEGAPYIAMELLKGESLAERAQAQGWVAPKEVARIVNEVAEGLTEAHELGIVHRDIKPQNLFLVSGRGGSTAKILDFGIARRESQGDAVMTTGPLVGTPYYMSPEQLLEPRSPDKSADIWALAVVAYELLTGKHPFIGDTPVGTMMSVTKGIFERASRHVELPDAVDAFFERAFAMERRARYATALELSAALSTALENAKDVERDPRRAPKAQAIDDTRTADFIAKEAIQIPAQAENKGISTLAASVELDRPEGPKSVPRRLPVSFGFLAGLVSLIAAVIGLAYWVGSRRSPESASPAAASQVAGPTASGIDSGRAPGPPDSNGAGTQQSAPALSSPTPIGVASDGYLRCPPALAAGCSDKAEAWCDRDDKPVACCGHGLVPVAKGRCACPPGGSTVKEVIDSGCASATPVENRAIGALLRPHLSDFRTCYERALLRNPKLRGRLSIHFEVGPTGVPGHIVLSDAGVPDPEFQDCASNVFVGVRFPAPADGHMSVEYPLEFSPG